MNVASVTNASLNTLPYVTNDENIDQDYAALIAQFYPAQEYKTRDEINAEDGELSKFKSDLVTKGVAVFLKELNEEKIEALVEEYREKLLKEKEKNPQIPMDINKMVSDFKKRLIEEMMEAQKAEQEKQKQEQKAKTIETQTLSTADIFGSIQDNDLKASNKKTVDILELMINTVCVSPNKKETDV